MHLVVISTLRQPQTLSYKLTALPGPTRSRTITARAIFDEDYAVGLNVSESGEAVFSDAIESFGQKFYRLGCARPAANTSNAVVDPSFEGYTHQAGFQGLNTAEYRGPWGASCRKHYIINGTYPFCDPRLHTKWSTAAPRSGRHSLTVQIPTLETIALVNFPQKWPLAPAVPEDRDAAVMYRVEIWARSSPHLVNATLRVGFAAAAWAKAHKGEAVDPPGTIAESVHLTAGRWVQLAVEFRNATRGTARLVAQLELAPTVGVAATVWVDDASITALPRAAERRPRSRELKTELKSGDTNSSYKSDDALGVKLGSNGQHQAGQLGELMRQMSAMHGEMSTLSSTIVVMREEMTVLKRDNKAAADIDRRRTEGTDLLADRADATARHRKQSAAVDVCTADINSSGSVSTADLLLILAAFGARCEVGGSSSDICACSAELNAMISLLQHPDGAAPAPPP